MIRVLFYNKYNYIVELSADIKKKIINKAPGVEQQTTEPVEQTGAESGLEPVIYSRSEHKRSGITCYYCRKKTFSPDLGDF
jgi:hypothetical protein